MTTIETPDERDLDFLGEFLGDEYSEERLDVLLAYAVNPSDLETARSLMGKKWWDYRFIHPGYCFFLFAHHFGQAVETYRSKFGVNPYAQLKATEHPIFRPRKERRGRSTVVLGTELSPAQHRTGLWRSMCFADEYGVPYDRWLHHAFEFALECNWQRVPTPNNICGTATARYVIEQWEAEKTASIITPKDPFYLAANNVGHPYQIEFETWLLNLISRRARPELALRHYLSVERLVRPRAALDTLGPELCRRALKA